MATEKVKITVSYSAIDGTRFSQEFKTLRGAQRFAQKWVGTKPEISDMFQYAVSFDGVGKVTCQGCRLRELFPELPKEPEPVFDEY